MVKTFRRWKNGIKALIDLADYMEKTSPPQFPAK